MMEFDVQIWERDALKVSAIQRPGIDRTLFKEIIPISDRAWFVSVVTLSVLGRSSQGRDIKHYYRATRGRHNRVVLKIIPMLHLISIKSM